MEHGRRDGREISLGIKERIQLLAEKKAGLASTNTLTTLGEKRKNLLRRRRKKDHGDGFTILEERGGVTFPTSTSLTMEEG